MRPVLLMLSVSSCTFYTPEVHPLGALEASDGRVQGYVDLGGPQPIWFTSGVAYRNDAGEEVIRLTSWPNVSCDPPLHRDWKTFQDGWYLEFPHDGQRVRGGHAVMGCKVGELSPGSVECRGGKAERLDIELELEVLTPARGGPVEGRAVLSQDGRPKGEIRFQLTHCGEHLVGLHSVQPFGRRARWEGSAPPPGWGPLWPQLESCGQLPHDNLSVFLSDDGDGLRPWRVEVARSTPGAEACLASVLSEAPIDGRFDPRGAIQYDQFRVEDLRSPRVPADRPSWRCGDRPVPPRPPRSGGVPVVGAVDPAGADLRRRSAGALENRPRGPVRGRACRSPDGPAEAVGAGEDEPLAAAGRHLCLRPAAVADACAARRRRRERSRGSLRALGGVPPVPGRRIGALQRRTPLGRCAIDATRDMVRREAGALTTEVRKGATTMAGMLGTLWAVHFVNWLVFDGGLSVYGIMPRTVDGLWGILTSPFLHVGLGHLIANTIGFLMLAPMVFLRKRMDFWVVTVAGALGGGLVVWMIGRMGFHQGFSGVIFAYLGFLMTRGLWERSWGTLALSGFVTWFFGSMLWGMVPFLAGAVSWEGHLGGFLAGIEVARLLGKNLEEKGQTMRVRRGV